MKGEEYAYKVGKISKFKSFFYILIFEIARIPFLTSRIRIALYKLAGIEIGKDVYIGSGLKVSDPVKASYIKIGDRVSIADNVYLINSSGPNNSKLKKLYPRIIGRIHLEDDVWIGVNVIIFPGVRIGNMSAIGAGTVVTKDVDENSIVAGNPAKIIKKLEKTQVKSI